MQNGVTLKRRTPTPLAANLSVTRGAKDINMGKPKPKALGLNERVREKTRYQFGPLTVASISHYEIKSWDGEGSKIMWRQMFRDIHGKVYVYSGNHLGVNMGDNIYLWATVKKVDKVWGCVRLCRPVVIHNVQEERLGL